MRIHEMYKLSFMAVFSKVFVQPNVVGVSQDLLFIRIKPYIFLCLLITYFFAHLILKKDNASEFYNLNCGINKIFLFCKHSFCLQ